MAYLVNNTICIEHATAAFFSALLLFSSLLSLHLSLALNALSQRDEVLGSERFIYALNAFIQGRVSGEHADFLTITKQHVADFLSFHIQIGSVAID